MSCSAAHGHGHSHCRRLLQAYVQSAMAVSVEPGVVEADYCCACCSLVRVGHLKDISRLRRTRLWKAPRQQRWWPWWWQWSGGAAVTCRGYR